MKILRAHCWKENLELTKPYTIAYTTVDAVENFFVFLELENGLTGIGAGSPSDFVTGEDLLESFAALNTHLEALVVGEDIRHFSTILRQIRAILAPYPAARAAIDIALYDAFTKMIGTPLADYLGKAHEGLPTSITIGIKNSVEEVLTEAEEYLSRGFGVIKLKIGYDPEQDAAYFEALRRLAGPDVVIRVDANQGYTPEGLLRFAQATASLGVEFYEQPFEPHHLDWQRGLPGELSELCAADEDLLGYADALALCAQPQPYGIFNIKLMKCGGIAEAMRMADAAERSGIALMWGCNDESVASITAALHAALASPATRYLDLDGSFDLARDRVGGGFVLRQGCLYPADGPGLGLSLL